MNRAHEIIFRFIGAAIVLIWCFAITTMAQTPTPSPSPSTDSAKEAEADPFAPQPAQPLPAGMTGSDTTDPRAKLTPGIFDAGEAAMGLKHLLLLKKPDSFQLGSDDPDNPKVQKTLSTLGMASATKMAKPSQLVIAQLAFANSDLAFQGNYL